MARKENVRPISHAEVSRRAREMNELQEERSLRSLERTNAMRNELFAGVDPRRREEVANSGMLSEDPTAMANAPRQAIHTQYPQFPFYASPYIDDAINE